MYRATTRRSVFHSGLLTVLTLQFAALASIEARAMCPNDVPPQCGVSGDLGPGRWDLSGASGTVLNVSASDFQDPDFIAEYWYTGDGSLTLTRIGGADANFIEVSCDGTVTGQGRDRISGTLSMNPIPLGQQVFPYECVDPDDVSNAPPNLVDSLLTRSLEFTYERTYTITGSVTANGTVELDYNFTSVTFEQGGDLATGADGFCFFDPDEFEEPVQTITGAVPNEQVTLSGSYNSSNGIWQPTFTDRGSSWIGDLVETVIAETVVNPNGAGDAEQAEIDTTPTPLNFSPDTPGVPVVTSMTLTEPAHYLLAVDITTQLEISVDWRGEAPGSVEITYSGSTETVAGSDTVIWPFAAGEAGDTINVVAIQGADRSQPYTLAVPKVAVPGWAGSASDWTASPGIRYDATSGWPNPSVLQSLANVPLLGGPWGLVPAVSELELVANSDGSPGAGTLSGDVGARFAGFDFSFPISGTSETTLACDALSMTGMAQFPSLDTEWSDSFGVADLVPGLEAAACGASGILCEAVRSLTFMEAHASAVVSGVGDFEGAAGADDIEWTGGRITGDVEAGARLNLFPRVLQKVVNVGVSADGEACVEVEVAPQVAISELGASLEAKARAAIFSQGVSSSGEFNAGDDCAVALAFSPAQLEPPGELRFGASSMDPAFDVPGDGQVEVAINPDDTAEVQAAAVWRTLPDVGDRPGGSISIRTLDDSGWSSASTITDDAPADLAPVVAFDGSGNIVVVYQRNANPAAIPTDISQTDAFANGIELVYAIVNPATLVVEETAALTDNTLADIGNSLHRDTDGNVHLYWQRNTGTDFLGSVSNPAQIAHRRWDGTTWSAETIAVSNLVGHFGWSVAVRDSAAALVAIIQDDDDDLSTAADRELHVALQISGSWAPPFALTDDGVEDHSPIAGFLDDTTPIILWVSGQQVVSLSGDLSGPPSAVTQPSEIVGLDFADAAIFLDDNIDILWPDATELKALRRNAGSWSNPDTLLSNNSDIRPLAVRRNTSDELVYAQVERDIETGGELASTATVSLVNASVSPTVTEPGAPVIGQASAGNAQATVNFTPPADNGGSAITAYTATSSPGALTGTCVTSPCTVAGLTNGVTYTFTVTATSSAGTSAPSSSSNAVVPSATATDSDGDGTPDAVDPFPFARTTLSGAGVTLAATPSQSLSTCTLDVAGFEPRAAYTDPPPALANNAIGFAVGFTLSGCSAGESLDVVVDFGAPLPAGAVAYKVNGAVWRPIPGAVVAGSTVRYTLTDNGAFDTDPAPGAIADPVSAAMPLNPEAVPATPRVVLLLMAGLMLVLGTTSLSRRQPGF